MPTTRRPLPAIHDWHLERVLRELGLDIQIQAGDARCARCGVALSRERIGGILVLSEGRYGVVCDRPRCISQSQVAGAQ